MKGRKIFTKTEAEEIIKLIKEKLRSDSSKQKGIRAKIRKIGFYASDFGLGDGYTVQDYLNVVNIVDGDLIINKTSTAAKNKDITNYKSTQKRTDSDEAYVINLCDEVLGKTASRQHKFDYLRGDPGKNRTQGVKLPVDAYYEELKLIIEFRERQHSEEVKHFDKPDVITVSGVHRGEQRKIYDQRRRDELPKHGIKLVEISYDNFKYDRKKKIVRTKAIDIDVIKKLIQ